ncbi:MAG TPA: nucleoside triphosphate pyrophosphatase [Gemmatimonadales bacterium]|nr:nucleoside triphosphate pyrophosphatase [Gemmatimonadales bacterium]
MIVLASRSPRRRQLLEMLGIPHLVDPADVDERQQPGEAPEAFAARIARTKALHVAPRHGATPVLGADTVVVVNGATLGKPASPDEAARMLALLQGREHRVVTAVALAAAGRVHERCDVTRVWFRRLSPDQIRAYVATGEPLDKAGAYGVQGVGSVLVERVDGDFFGVMGLPLRLVVDVLESAGIPYAFTR